MPIGLRQYPGNVASLDSSSCRVSLNATTRQGSLVVVIASARVPPGSPIAFLFDPPGFSGVRVVERREDDIAVAVWARPNAAPMSSVTVFATHQSLAVRVVEVTGLAQSAALDRVAVGSGDSTAVSSGATGNTSQGEELVIGAIASQYASTTQSGFTGGLQRLTDDQTPTTDLDGERHRLTVHAGVANVVGSYALGGRLSTARDWIAVLLTFRSAVVGPLRATSLEQPPTITFGGRADLTAFGRLASLTQPTTITFGGSAWIGPFEDQFLLGGRGGLMMGVGTDYRIESVEGLGGADVRQSDTEFPRADGAQRGIDLQSPRTIVFDVNFDAPPYALEAAMQRLLAVLRPRRDEDEDLLYRLPGSPLLLVRYRPGPLNRLINAEQRLRTKQSFVLRCADPRIYSARQRQVVVPVSPTATGPVTVASAPNAGNGQAFPTIRMLAAEEVSRVQLVNVTGNVAFEVDAVLTPGDELVGDMPALITAAPRSYVRVNDQPKYAAWQSPREPFFLSAAPDAPGGINALYLRTTPPGARVACVLEYSDTSVT